jgi:NADH-quinone oxidoreductase subunit J
VIHRVRRGAGSRCALTARANRITPVAMELSVPVAVCCALASISALGVVLLRRPVHVALGLLGHSLSMAALYLTLSAQLMAVAQTLIYSGAVVVLFLIVVTLLPEGGQEKLSVGGMFLAVTAGLSVLAVLAAALSGLFAPGASSALPVLSGEGPSVKEVGKPLFSTLVEPFELTAPLLLAAIVTAIALWRRQEKPRAKGFG